MNEDWFTEAEKRRILAVHKWDYPYPGNLWESWPWWFRWPAAVVISLYFLGGLIVPFFWKF